METSHKWRYGKYRWMVLFFIVLGAIAAKYYPPITPHIQVAPEKLSTEPLFTLPVIGDFYLSNTLIASMIAYGLVIILAYFLHRAYTNGDLVPKGLSGAMEVIFELMYNLTESTAGKWAKTIFPYFATIVLVVLVANWTEMLPGVDSIGFIEKSETGGYVSQQIGSGVYTILSQKAAEGQEGYNIVPWVRVASTDLNFTVALALISVVMTQFVGIRAQGGRYFTKFINVKTFFSKPLFGMIDFVVGLLELISEIAKVLSFSFRLFGNVFAGSIMLFLVGSMIPIFAQSGVLLFEFFIGMIQAAVFGMLTMIFMASATQGHGGEHEEAH